MPQSDVPGRIGLANSPGEGFAVVTIKLGVLALAGPDNGGTYQYTLSMLQALQHTHGVRITLYGDPKNPDFAELGYPIENFAESRARTVGGAGRPSNAYQVAGSVRRAGCAAGPDLFALAAAHLETVCLYAARSPGEIFPRNFPWWQRYWRHQVYAQLSGQARRVVCESQYVKTDILRLFGTPAERIAVIAAPPLRQFVADEASMRCYRRCGFG